MEAALAPTQLGLDRLRCRRTYRNASFAKVNLEIRITLAAVRQYSSLGKPGTMQYVQLSNGDPPESGSLDPLFLPELDLRAPDAM